MEKTRYVASKVRKQGKIEPIKFPKDWTFVRNWIYEKFLTEMCLIQVHM